jgi:hypothetical protein
MKIKVLLILTFFIICSQINAQQSSTDFNFAQPEQVTDLTKMTLWATQYFIHKFQSKGSIPIVYQDGTPSKLTADTCDFCEAALEGTAFVTSSILPKRAINLS